MGVLIRPDHIAVSRVDTALDDHGWAEPTGLTVIATTMGTIQEQSPRSDATATDLGGDGPNDPFHQRVAVAYLSERVEPGDILGLIDSVGHAVAWQVQRCRLVEDPRGGGHLNVWVADCVEVR